MRGIILALIILFALGAIYVLRARPRPSPTAVVTPFPSPSPSSTLNPLSSQMSPAEVLVKITQDGFDPATVTIKQREKITWENDSGLDISINSDPHPTHTDFPALNLGKLPGGASVTLQFDTPGTYGYHNHFDPNQTGTIIVTVPTPTP